MSLFSLSDPKDLFFEFNNVPTSSQRLNAEKLTHITSDILKLEPGENTLRINFEDIGTSDFIESSKVIGVTSISFVDDSAKIISEKYSFTGEIWVVDDKSGCDEQGSLIHIDPNTGEQELISDNCISKEGNFVEPEEVVILSNGDLMILDKKSGCDDQGALIKVNPISGQQTIFSDNCISVDDLFDSPEDFTIDSEGNFLVVDKKSGCNSEGVLFKVDGKTGSQYAISDNCTDELSIFSSDLQGVEIDSDGNIFVVGDKGSGPNCSKGSGGGYVVRIDPNTGGKKLISDNCISTKPYFNEINDVLVDSDDNIIIVDEDSGEDGKGALISVDPTTGEQTIISENAMSKKFLYDDIQDAVIDSEGNFIVLEQDIECFLKQGPSAIIISNSLRQQNSLSDNCISLENLLHHPEGMAMGFGPP